MGINQRLSPGGCKVSRIPASAFDNLLDWIMRMIPEISSLVGSLSLQWARLWYRSAFSDRVICLASPSRFRARDSNLSRVTSEEIPLSKSVYEILRQEKENSHDPFIKWKKMGIRFIVYVWEGCATLGDCKIELHRRCPINWVISDDVECGGLVSPRFEMVSDANPMWIMSRHICWQCGIEIPSY
jgi:hypothetical protein